MSIFEERGERLRALIDLFIHWTSRDYFIPHMLRHHMSASFVPNRMEEIFTGLYADNVEAFTQYVQSERKTIKQFIADTEPTVDHLRTRTQRSSTRALDLRSELQEQREILVKQRNEIRELSNCRVKSLAKQINAVNIEITKLRTVLRQIHVSVEAAELQIQNGRQFISEVHKTQIAAVQNLRHSLTEKNWRTHFRAYVRFMKSDCIRMKRENEIQSAALCEVRRLFGEKRANEDADDRLMVLRAVNDAKECNELQRICDELELPQSSVLSSESLADAVSTMVKAHIDRKEFDLRKKLEEYRGKERELRSQLNH
jgi:hypothetical protein